MPSLYGALKAMYFVRTDGMVPPCSPGAFTKQSIARICRICLIAEVLLLVVLAALLAKASGQWSVSVQRCATSVDLRSQSACLGAGSHVPLSFAGTRALRQLGTQPIEAFQNPFTESPSPPL